MTIDEPRIDEIGRVTNKGEQTNMRIKYKKGCDAC